MAQTSIKLDLLGRREAVALAAATTSRVFAGASGAPLGIRQGVSFTNHDFGAELWLTFAQTGASAPTIIATDCDLILPPRSTRWIPLGINLEIWVRSSSASAVNYTALELA